MSFKRPCSGDNSGLVAEAWSLAHGSPPCDSAEILVHLILQDLSLFFISSAPGWEPIKKKSQRKYLFSPFSPFTGSAVFKIEENIENILLG